MDKFRSFNLFNYINGPKSESYKDKLLHHCLIGGSLGVLVSLAFSYKIIGSIAIGVAIPMGYLHKDLVNELSKNKDNLSLSFLKINKTKNNIDKKQ